MGYGLWKELEVKEVPANSKFSEKIFECLGLGSRVLDLGCGYGRLSDFLFSRGFEVYGIDVNEKAIEEARKDEREGLVFSVQDALSTEFDSGFFDGIVSQAVLACMTIEERKIVIAECSRILKPEGVIQIAEFGTIDDVQMYRRHEQLTGEYGTVVIRRSDGTDWFWSHNFEKDELVRLLEDGGLEILYYENPEFDAVDGTKYPGHIFLCRKSD